MEEQKAKVVVQDLYKIFGPNPERAYALIEQGKSKDEILEETGLTIGVQKASFEVYEGEVFVVMGLSGSGKSTLVRMLNRLIEPTSGNVFLEGKDIAKMSKDDLIDIRRKRMSMVFQSFALMPHLTVLENAGFGLEVAGIPPQEQHKRAMNALEQVGLKAYAQSYPQELSGGMQQRVGLARGLAVDPTIMLMDEAFSALDPLIRTEMQDELIKLQQESKRTVVFISHDLDEAMRIGDRIAMMEGGRIVQVGTPEEILKNPADEYVKAFFRGVDPTNVLKAGDVVRNNQVTIIRHKGGGPRAAMERLMDQDRSFGYILDADRKFLGVVSVDSLRTIIDTSGDDSQSLQKAFLENVQTVSLDTPMQDILPFITQLDCPVPVVDDKGVYQGAVSKNRFLKTLKREG
ncbi:MAG: glycine betaine/L-proline ABC transporter ATP-binding protein ProV [Desulfovermiculus sp.]|nr:glycine betaine/L-proline ABC transporter ATP-binding protein ProV [Desulfovermiculus sp.]